jgi:hypothetical protein
VDPSAAPAGQYLKLAACGKLTLVSRISNRLPSYFLIAVAVIFMTVQAFAIVKHVRLQNGPTTPDYINAVKIVLAMMAIVVAVRSLMRDQKGGQ